MKMKCGEQRKQLLNVCSIKEQQFLGYPKKYPINFQIAYQLSFLCHFQLLQQRTWLIHWSLFVFFNHAKGRDEIIDLFLYQPPYLNAIQTMCPWVLRYLTTAVITNKRRRQVLIVFYILEKVSLSTYFFPKTTSFQISASWPE